MNTYRLCQLRADLSLYPIDMTPLLALSPDCLDEAGVLYRSPSDAFSTTYHPTSIAQYALAHWNAYLAHECCEHRDAFLCQARWLLAHQVHLANDIGGWPIEAARPSYYAFRPWLSALAQGSATSVLVRAYQLTSEDAFLHAARLAVRAFELDILDGGVRSDLRADGLFFEEVAVYPAAHILSGHMLALFGLYDYVAVTKEHEIEMLIEQGISALHTLLELFDTGYWTRYDLLHNRLASQSHHSLHVTLLEAHARYAGCEQCATVASRWANYLRHPGSRLRYQVASRFASGAEQVVARLRRMIFPNLDTTNPAMHNRVCLPITAFPVQGGMRGVLAGVAQVMGKQWQMVYLTNYRGECIEGMDIEVFGRRIASPWQFPTVWLYWLSGLSKLFSLLRDGPGYGLILPQDGVFTGAFAALIAKMAGVRVICMDHGNVTLLGNPAFRKEHMQMLKSYAWPRRLLARLHLACYWSSLDILARIATRCTDHFLIAGDEVEEAARQKLGIHPSRITRYAYMIDAARFTPPDQETRAAMRAAWGLTEEAIVIALINRLAPEKGLDVAVEGIAQALSALPSDRRCRVKVLIAGNGPLRAQVEADILRHNLVSTCILTGEAKPADVITLLGISDIFLYSGTRGTNYSMAVLEAMAAGCAVIASTSPQSNAQLLAEGRGIAVIPGDAVPIATALIHLCSDLELCRQMGRFAREYVRHFHGAEMLKRNLLRATYFAPAL